MVLPACPPWSSLGCRDRGARGAHASQNPNNITRDTRTHNTSGCVCTQTYYINSNTQNNILMNHPKLLKWAGKKDSTFRKSLLTRPKICQIPRPKWPIPIYTKIRLRAQNSRASSTPRLMSVDDEVFPAFDKNAKRKCGAMCDICCDKSAITQTCYMWS